MADWLYIGYCTVMAMFAVAAAYAAAFGLRALRRLPRSLLVGFAAAAIVATLTAQKTNNVPPNMNQPQMMQGGGSFQTGFTGLTGLVGIGSIMNLVNPVQTTIDDIMRGWRVESVTTNAAVLYAMPTNAALVGNWHIHGVRTQRLSGTGTSTALARLLGAIGLILAIGRSLSERMTRRFHRFGISSTVASVRHRAMSCTKSALLAFQWWLFQAKAGCGGLTARMVAAS